MDGLLLLKHVSCLKLYRSGTGLIIWLVQVEYGTGAGKT